MAGIALAAVYAPNGWIGSLLDAARLQDRLSRRSASFVALVFIGLPFVVRTVQPVLEDLDQEIEEASALARRGRLRTVISKWSCRRSCPRS